MAAGVSQNPVENDDVVNTTALSEKTYSQLLKGIVSSL
jgi:hypothetical protein